MDDCEHKSVRGSITRKLLGECFEAKGTVCDHCGTQFWDKKDEDAFQVWLRNKIAEPDFRSQLTINKLLLTRDSQVFIKKLEHDYLVSKEKAVNAIISVYLIEAWQDENISNALNSMTIENATIDFGPILLCPSLFMRVHSTAKLFDFTVDECAYEMVNRMSTFLSRDNLKLNPILEVLLTS